MSEEKMNKLSHMLSAALRHGKYGTADFMRDDAYVKIKTLLKVQQFKNFETADIRKIVEGAGGNHKKRFEIDETQTFIRARQGHTLGDMIDADKIMERMTEPVPCCVHGTYLSALGVIEKEGLCRMARDHIHFAIGLPGEDGVISGMRGSAQVLIYVDVAKALADGIIFYKSSNGVILSPGIGERGLLPPNYFAKIEKVKQTVKEKMKEGVHSEKDGSSSGGGGGWVTSYADDGERNTEASGGWVTSYGDDGERNTEASGGWTTAFADDGEWNAETEAKWAALIAEREKKEKAAIAAEEEKMAALEAARMDKLVFGGSEWGLPETNHKEEGEDDDDEDWSTDVSAEAVAARAEEQSQKRHKEQDEWQKVEGIDLKAIGGAVDAMKAQLQDFSSDSAASMATEMQMQLGLPACERISIYFFAAFGADVVKEIPQRIGVLRELADTSSSQKRLLGCCERLCGLTFPSLVKKYPVVLKMLYDEDLLDEETIVDWADSISARFGFKDVTEEVKAKLTAANEPFITWLEQAEASGSEDSDSDSDSDSDNSDG